MNNRTQNSSRSVLVASICYRSILMLVATTAAYVTYRHLSHPEVLPPLPGNDFGESWMGEWWAPSIFAAIFIPFTGFVAFRGGRDWVLLAFTTQAVALMILRSVIPRSPQMTPEELLRSKVSAPTSSAIPESSTTSPPPPTVSPSPLSKRSVGYASARLEAAKIKAAKDHSHE